MVAKKTAIRETMRALTDCYHNENEAYHRAARKMGLSDSAFCILYDLHEQDGLTQKEMAEGNGLSKQTVHSSVKRLEEDGIVRTETCGRNSRVYLTDEGRRFVRERIDPVIEAECRALEVLSDGDRTRILALNRKFVDALRAAMDEI